MQPGQHCEQNLLSRLARYCAECRMIQAKDQRRLSLTETDKRHLLLELYFIQGTKYRHDKRNPTLRRWPRR